MQQGTLDEWEQSGWTVEASSAIPAAISSDPTKAAIPAPMGEPISQCLRHAITFQRATFRRGRFKQEAAPS